jgi:hypothetical protein
MKDTPTLQNKLVIGISAVGIAIAIALIVIVTLKRQPSGRSAGGIDSVTVLPLAATATPSEVAPPQHYFETKEIDSAIAAYNPQWDLIRKAPKVAVGISYTWTAKVAWILGDAVGVGEPGRIVQYDVVYEVPPPQGLSYEQLLEYNGIVSRGLPDVNKDDLVRVTGTFSQITPDGALEFEPTALTNYGKLIATKTTENPPR